MNVAPNDLAARIAAVLSVDSSANAIEFDGAWRTWGQLADTVGQVTRVVEPGVDVGIVLRNRPASIGMLLGVLVAGGCVVTVNPSRGVERTRDDLRALDLPLLAGDPDDLARVVPPECSATRLSTAELGTPVVVEPSAHDGQEADPARDGVAVRMLTSGTTGPPKRIDLTYATLEKVMVTAKHYESNRNTSVRLRRGVAVVNSPLVHLGGLFRVLQCVTDGRSFAFLERFTVDGWVDAVRRHRPATASLVPAALRMVLDADLDPVDLGSLRSVVSGTAPLDPDDADAFRAKYGVPVLISYAATEFGGPVAGWNLDDHRAHWSTKRGSVGRVHAGCELRVVDAETGHQVPNGDEGLLEVRAGQLARADWIRTTDLARLDDDGFLWISGRADHAIIRGGFKVLPDDIRAAIERHPAVRGAAVVRGEDRRLGAVPLAAVELRPGAEGLDAEELLAFLGSRLARYELPTEVRIVDHLPRTDSHKVDLGAVSEMFADVTAGA